MSKGLFDAIANKDDVRFATEMMMVADVNATRMGMSPLRAAVEGNWTNAVTKLLAAGADPNKQEGHGTTPLARAVAKNLYLNDPPLVNALLAGGANPNEVDIFGTPLLHQVVLLNNEICRLFLAAGANPNARDREGQTALHRACKYDTDCISDLLAAGADPTTPDHEGQTPFSLASAHNPQMVALLIEHERRALRQAADEAQAKVPSLGGLAARLDARTGTDQPDQAAPRARRRL